MTELKTPTAVLHEGPRVLSEQETAAIERHAPRGIRDADIDDVIEYVHHGLRKLPDFVTLYRKYLKQRGTSTNSTSPRTVSTGWRR